MCDCVDGQDQRNEIISTEIHEERGKWMEEFMDDEKNKKVLQMFACRYVDKMRVEQRVI
jgi:hypothetical protein